MIGHVVPEAAKGGAIAFVHSGDEIVIDFTARTMHVAVADAEMAARRAAWTAPEPREKTGILARYAKLVSNASCGAVLA